MMQRSNPEEQQFTHLMRLAWDLRWLGLAVAVELPREDEPFVLVRRAADPLRVRATLRGGRWIFSWGRGRTQWVDALHRQAARHVQEAAR
jgi:hypothetical protein